jgi:predicted DNA-binding transcriptional regulator AlpA
MAAGDIEGELRRVVSQAGGLVAATDLAEQWEVSRQRAHQLIAAEDFPRPIATVAGRPVWARCQTDAWREQRSGRRRSGHDAA